MAGNHQNKQETGAQAFDALGNLKVNIQASRGLTLNEWDYFSMALSGGNTTETYTFKIGGAGGTTVNTVVIVYTDSSRLVITSLTKT